MKRFMYYVLACIFIFALFVVPANAHFGMIIPSDQMIFPGDNTDVTLKLMFAHPFEGHGMNLDKPVRFGVFANDRKKDILGTLKPITLMGGRSWETTYKIKRPGVYMFYMEPEPYLEPAGEIKGILLQVKIL